MRVMWKYFCITILIVLSVVAPAGAEADNSDCETYFINERYSKTHNCIAVFQEQSPSEIRAAITSIIPNINGKSDHRNVAFLLDILRKDGSKFTDIAPIISQYMLPHQANIYSERDKWHVLRLRAYTFLTLNEMGFPDSALPDLIDAVAYVDERMTTVEFGAATFVVGSLGEKGRPLIPYMIKSFGERYAEEEFSLKQYDVIFDYQHVTTVQIEVIKALGNIATPADEKAVELLTFLSEHQNQMLDTRLKPLAKNALSRVLRRVGFETKSIEDMLDVTPWVDALERHTLQNSNIKYTDHTNANGTLDALLDRPVLMAFFFTGCQNADKCALTISRMASIQREVQQQGLKGKVRFIAVTLEPHFDNPQRLTRYTTERGLALGGDALSVSLDPLKHYEFLKELEAPVGYNAGWVSSHGVEGVLFDKNGRLARKYKALNVSDNDAVLFDFKRLLAE